MLDEIALLVRAEGGAVAGRLADSEAAIIPMLQREVMCTSRLEQGRRVQDGLHRALDTLASAYAWASYDRRFGGTTTSGAAPGSAGPTAASPDAGRLSGSASAGDSDALEVAVQDLLAQLADAAHVVHGLNSVDAELQIGASPGGVQALLRIARATLLQVGGECERLEARRAQALHDLAAARAVRTAILRGVI
jgi:hypothetical protein